MKKSKQKIIALPKDRFDHLMDHYIRATSPAAQIAILICMLGLADTYDRCLFVFKGAPFNTKFYRDALRKLGTLANKSPDPDP